MGDIIVLIVLTGIVVLVVRSMWKNYKKGGHCSSCSGGCSGCPKGCERKGRLSVGHEI